MIIADLMKKGFKVAIPFGEDWRYDLIAMKEEKLYRVQCKYTNMKDGKITVWCRCSNNWAVTQYNSKTVDWIAVYDNVSESCYYISSANFDKGRASISLRVQPPKK